jgi:hypothetical protein
LLDAANGGLGLLVQTMRLAIAPRCLLR